jgi:GMP synthase (glutamine-hydrolysing)
MENGIIILDFGSQYTQLIARRIRELGFYAEIHPYFTSVGEIKKFAPGGIILSGSPASAYDNDAPMPDAAIFEMEIPVMGICYGLCVLTHFFGGKVEPSTRREYGKSSLKIKKTVGILDSIPDNSQVWMSHGDKVTALPHGFAAIGKTANSPFAVIYNKEKKFYGVQFHPEVGHSKYGKDILKNFCEKVCGLKKTWTMKNFAKKQIYDIRSVVGDQKVILGLSGGVDSMVTARLIHDAIGDQLTCVYVDHGFMRLNETGAVVKRFGEAFHIPLKVVRAEDVFLSALKGITDPEQKRKIIGRLFLEEFKKVALEKNKDGKTTHYEFLAQGTLYTDVIESVSVKGPSQTIKSHHNRVQEIMDMIQAGRIIEPLKELFKDEVRKLGLALKMPRELLFRHPFPGPGLAIRILTDITKERLDLLRKADAILLEELKSQKLYSKVWQAFAVFLPVQSVGVMGDKRTYENVIALRMVESQDGMTADFARVPHDFLGHVSNRIINEVAGINRVVYDISTKPPATIEWE